MKNKLYMPCLAMFLLALATGAGAQVSIKTAQKVVEEGQEALEKNADRGPGVRVGAGLNPEQFVLGFRFAVDRKKPPRLVPSVDFGFGDHVTVFALNFDLIYRLRVEGTTRVIYGGAGPTLAYFDRSNSSWNVGLSVIAGMRLSKRLKRPVNVEARFGTGDIPDLRVLLVIGL